MSYYLKPNVHIEPLVSQWHAHLGLIAPHTASVYTTSQLAILKSYVQMPMAHASALKDPDQAGGPFVDLGGQRVDEVRQLRADMEQRAKPLLELAQAVKDLSRLLATEAHGLPLAGLYDQIPAPLKGLVELTYDLSHRPDFRFYEALLYREPLYNLRGQTTALSLIESDKRPFIFSTPRLPGPGTVHFPYHFQSEGFRALCRLKWEPRPLDDILEGFEVPSGEQKLFKSFFHQDAPQHAAPFKESGVRLRYFGHACLLLESRGVSILLDPLISYKYPSPIERLTFEDLPPRIDYVLITHAHHDHLVLEALLQLRERIGTLVVPRTGGGQLHDPSLKLALNCLGFDNVMEIDDMQTLSFPGGCIQAIPFMGEHCDLSIRAKSAYLLRLAGSSFLAFADASCISPEVYEHVRREVGRVDAMFIGLESTGAPMSWAYGPLFTEKLERNIDQQRRSNGSNAASALRLAEIFGCERVFLYAMGLEPWLNYLMALQHGHQTATTQEIELLRGACILRGIETETLYAKRDIVFAQKASATSPAEYSACSGEQS